MKRVLLLAVGLGAGLVLGAYVVRQLQAAQQAVAPANVAGRAGRAAGDAVTRLRAALDEGRTAAEEREAELRASFDVPSVRGVLRQ